MKNFLVGAGLAALAFASSAQAAVNVHTSSFISSPTNFNDFETLAEGFPSNTIYSKDGIDVEYVGAAFMWTTYSAQGDHSWYPDGGGTGYTRIGLTGGGTFSAIEFLAGHGYSGSNLNLQYELRLGGSLVATGYIANVYGQYGPSGLAAYGFDGDTFDEVRLQVRSGETTFDGNAYEALALDNIKIGDGTPAVPEPASWAMMIGGFAIAGAAMRRRSTTVRFA